MEIQIRFMHFDKYNDAFNSLVGKNNVGWFAKNYDGIIVDCDPAYKFAELCGIDRQTFIGKETKHLPWGSLYEKIEAAEVLVKFGEVRESQVTYWHPLDNMYRRALAAKFLQTEGVDRVLTIAADITEPTMTTRMAFLSQAITVDWEKEKITIFGKTINRLDLIVLGHYLHNLTHEQIAEKVHRSKKSIDKRLCKMRDILCSLDPETSTLFELCRKYEVDKMLAEKSDWFDRLPVIRPTNHLQFKL